MKLGCSSWSHHKAIVGGRLSQFDWLRLCADELALDGVELLDLHFPTTDTPYLRELKRLCVELHLSLSCLAVSNDFGRPSAGERDFELLRLMRWLDVAAFLGAPLARVFAGWPPPSRKELLWPEMVGYLRQGAAYAQERGIVLALENHDDGGFVSTPAEVERCLAEVGSPWLRLCLDVGDLGGDVAAIQQTVRYAAHAHAKLYELDGRGAEKRLDWPAIIDVFQRAGYRGFLSIEYEGEEPAETALPRGVGYLRGLLVG